MSFKSLTPHPSHMLHHTCAQTHTDTQIPLRPIYFPGIAVTIPLHWLLCKDVSTRSREKCSASWLTQPWCFWTQHTQWTNDLLKTQISLSIFNYFFFFFNIKSKIFNVTARSHVIRLQPHGLFCSCPPSFLHSTHTSFCAGPRIGEAKLFSTHALCLECFSFLSEVAFEKYIK